MPDKITLRFADFQISLVVNRRHLLQRLENWIQDAGPGQSLIAINPEKLMKARTNINLRDLFKKSSANYADGVGAVWAARLLTGERVERIPGVDLFQDVLRCLHERKGSVFLFGGTEVVNRDCAAKIQSEFPNVRIAGRKSGYGFESNALAREIASCQPDVLAVALGSPQQEEWILRFGEHAGARLCMGLGGTFDVISGKVSRAPQWIRSVGFEWAYRVFQNPRRIRRLIALPRFVFWILRQPRLKPLDETSSTKTPISKN